MKQNRQKAIEQGKNIYEVLNASFKVVKRSFVLAYFIAEGGNDEAGIKTIKSISPQEERLKITTY